jgi:hypothetical protein
MPIRQGGILAEPRFHLATRPLLPQHDGAARIAAHEVERVLADIDADHLDRSIGPLRHGVLLVFGAPCQLRLLVGQEHDRTIPLTDFVLSEPTQVAGWKASGVPYRIGAPQRESQHRAAIMKFL